MEKQSTGLEGRVNNIEHDITRVKAYYKVLVLIGLGLGAAAAVAFTTLSNISDRISTVFEDANALEQKVSNIDAVINSRIQSAINEDLLILSFNNQSVIGQVQAQAICTAIAPKNTTVMAVYRRPTGNNPSGAQVSEICSDICPRHVMRGSGQIGEATGAVHVYDDNRPFKPLESGITSLGMATHVYSAPGDNKQFGPNYCCCAG